MTNLVFYQNTETVFSPKKREKQLLLDNYEPSDSKVIKAMFDLAEVNRGDKHIELGSGDGRFVAEANRLGAHSVGYEIDDTLVRISKKNSINVIKKNVFDVDVSEADLVTFWFTRMPEVKLLMQKLKIEMKLSSRLIAVGHNLTHDWKPSLIRNVNRFNIYLFKK